MVEQAPEILAARAREGDEAAFRALVEGLTRTLMATAFRYTGDWEWARDLTQDTWVRVYRKLDRWDEALLHRVALRPAPEPVPRSPP